MTQRRWPLIAALAAALLLIASAWAAGRASAPNTPNDDTTTDASSAIRTINGVPVGVQQSRTGALAAADNYVARVTETVVQDPRAYVRLVRSVWVPTAQEAALEEGTRARARSADAGVQVLSVFQNLSQISERWGRDRADTLIANHTARLFGSGIADRATLDYLGAILGDEEIQKISTHRQRLDLELGSRTYSNDYKRLGAPDRIRQTQPHTALLVYANLPPAWISLRPWYRDRQLRAQATTPAPNATLIGGDLT